MCENQKPSYATCILGYKRTAVLFGVEHKICVEDFHLDPMSAGLSWSCLSISSKGIHPKKRMLKQSSDIYIYILFILIHTYFSPRSIFLFYRLQKLKGGISEEAHEDASLYIYTICMVTKSIDILLF